MSKVSMFLKHYKRYSYKFTLGAVFHNAVPKHACFGSRDERMDQRRLADDAADRG
jgi:hypothetical protein